MDETPDTDGSDTDTEGGAEAHLLAADTDDPEPCTGGDCSFGPTTSPGGLVPGLLLAWLFLRPRQRPR